ncbi:MAG: hypothetical protein AB1585_01860 [Thermodesulfobacteriota bacterium]
MGKRKQRVFIGFLVIGCFFTFLAWAHGASQEIRPADQLSGSIVAPLEERKQALSAGDKIFVALDKNRPVKKGDLLEIYQPTSLTAENKTPVPFYKAGQVIVLGPVNDRLLLGVIEASDKEIAVGDRIYFPATGR